MEEPNAENMPKDEALLPGKGAQDIDAESGAILDGAERRRQVRVHYYVKIGVCTFLCALLLVIGVPVFMESRITGSLSYTALGVVLVGFGLVLAASAVALVFHPPFNKDGSYK